MTTNYYYCVYSYEESVRRNETSGREEGLESTFHFELFYMHRSFVWKKLVVARSGSFVE